MSEQGAMAKLREIIIHCEEVMTVRGKVSPIEGIEVGYVLPGKWGKKDRRRIWPGGPVGEIVGDMMLTTGRTGVYVMFKAAEVKAAAEKKLAELGRES